MGDLSELGAAAVAYAEGGWAVLALKPRSKIPATKHGVDDATTDVDAIRSWWEEHPTCNVGIACGQASGGLVAIDLDVEDDGIDGRDTLHDWESEHGELPDTLAAVTGGGGYHLLFVVDGACPPSVNHESAVDIRGDGSYIVAPPSVHTSGATYAWDIGPDERDPAHATDNVLAFIASVRPDSMERKGKLKPPKGPIRKGSRNDTLYRTACSLQSLAYDDATITATIEAMNAKQCVPPLERSDVDKLLASALGHEKGRSFAKATVDDAVSLRRDDNGKPYQTMENIIAVLEHDPRIAGKIRYNTVDFSPFVSGQLPWADADEYRRWQDSDYANLRGYIERYGLSSKDKMIDAVTCVAHAHRYNPITEFLDGLAWDGRERVSTLLTDFLGADMSEYNMRLMHLFMWGAVARAYRPGTKFDVVPIIHGAQGVGKSMFVRRLAVNPTWFDDNFNTIDGVAAAEKLRGMWIVEIAELLAMKKAKEVEAVKSFLTSTVDNYRPAYGRMTEQHPRACVFMGTTNRDEFLTDTTGNRRYYPIDIPSGVKPDMDIFDGDFCVEWFTQAWAEAVHEWRTGKTSDGVSVSLTMPRELEDEVRMQQVAHTEDDPSVGIIGDFLDQKWNIALAGGMRTARTCAAEIARDALGYKRGDTPQWVFNKVRETVAANFPEWLPVAGKKKFDGFGVQRIYEKTEGKDKDA